MAEREATFEAGLVGRRTKLIPIEPAHYSLIRRFELSPSLAFRWRFHGNHEAPEEFAARLWSDALAHFLVVGIPEADPLGMISLYRPDHANGSVFLAAASFLEGREVGSRIIGAIGLALDYAYFGWPFRKVYFESAEYNLLQFESARGWLLVEEARFREHIFLKDRFWDLVVLALWRETWIIEREKVLRFA
jgi:hypothetical protein